MRILQLHNDHAGTGGALEVMRHEAELLFEAGHAVTQYTMPPAEELGLSAVRAGAKAVWNRAPAAEVERRIDDFKPDVVHVHTPFPLMSPAVFRAAYGRGVPAVTTLHTYRYSCVAGTCHRDGHICEDCVGKRLKLPGIRHRCYRNSVGGSGALTLGLAVHRSMGTFHRCVARYLTLTEFSRRLLIRDGFPPDRIVVKPNSVDDPGFAPEARTDERRLVFAGRLLDIKGVRTMLDAWSQVPSGMRLVIAGDGPMRPVVEERAAADPSVDYCGWVRPSDVLGLIAGAEAVLVPSEWYEGLPLVILRSLAVGTPVVVSDLDNICEAVVEDEAGWAFRVRNVGSLAQRLAALAADSELARTRRTAARASYENRYSTDADLRRLEDIYRSLA
jgi:glycosyltransferase involved in cell wall biosynthesis